MKTVPFILNFYSSLAFILSIFIYCDLHYFFTPFPHPSVYFGSLNKSHLLSSGMTSHQRPPRRPSVFALAWINLCSPWSFNYLHAISDVSHQWLEKWHKYSVITIANILPNSFYYCICPLLDAYWCQPVIDHCSLIVCHF